MAWTTSNPIAQAVAVSFAVVPSYVYRRVRCELLAAEAELTLDRNGFEVTAVRPSARVEG